MPKRRYTREQYKAMFAAMNQYHRQRFKQLRFEKRWGHDYSYGKLVPKDLSIIVRDGDRRLGSLNLTVSGDRDWLDVDNVNLFGYGAMGVRLGSRVYIEALREAKKAGFRGLRSNPVSRNMYSNKVWEAIGAPRFQGFDYVTSVKHHAKRRGEKKRLKLRELHG